MKSPIITHLGELRKRVFICMLFTLFYMLISYIFYEPLYQFFSKPFLSIGFDNHPFYIRSILEGFFVKLKFSFLFGIIFSIPVYLFHSLRFCLPGLKRSESRIIMIALFFSFIFSCASFTYGYYLLLPLSIKFLMSYHFIPQDVGILLTYSDNLFIVFNLLAAIIVVFQLPVILMLLLYFKLVSRSFLLKASRYIVIIAFILSAILTPPDVVSQLMVSLPLIAFFFIVIAIASIFRWGKHV